jgi:hypothetical protein
MKTTPEIYTLFVEIYNVVLASRVQQDLFEDIIYVYFC